MPDLNIHQKSTAQPRSYSLVPVCESVKHLGIIVDCNVKCSVHISSLSKAHSRSGLVHEFCVSEDIHCLLRVLRTCVHYATGIAYKSCRRPVAASTYQPSGSLKMSRDNLLIACEDCRTKLGLSVETLETQANK